jgi:hypothetical protein
MSRLADFVEDQTITKFNDLCSSNEEEVFIVIGCYFGVEKGIDMWLPENATHFDPKFRLKIRVGNNEKETIFLSDCVSMMVAQDTCDVLMSLVGLCNAQCRLLFYSSVFLCFNVLIILVML